MTKDEARRTVDRIFEKHPYLMTLRDYYDLRDAWRVLDPPVKAGEPRA